VLSGLSAGSLALWGLRTVVVADPYQEANAYEEFWFTGRDELVGILPTETGLTAEILNQGGSKPREFSLSSQSQISHWSVANDGTLASWIADDRLYCQDLFQPAGAVPTSVALTRPNPIGMAVVEPGVAIAYPDATVELWSCSAGKLSTEKRNSQGRMDTFVGTGRYVALASRESAEVQVLRVSTTGDWYLMERAQDQPPLKAVSMSVGGRVALLGKDSFTTGGNRVSTPGNVDSVAFGYGGRIFAAGDFPGIYLLDSSGQLEMLYDTPPGISQLAVGKTMLAYSAGGPVSVVNLHDEKQLTQTGQYLAVSTAGFLGIAFLLPILRLVRLMLRKLADSLLSSGGSRQYSLPQQIPPDLVSACAAGECVLYAGAGLSAQSGFPVWVDFARALVEWASETGEVDNRSLAQMKRACAGRRPNEGIEAVLGLLRNRRTEIVTFYRSVFRQSAPLSATHRKLADIPFAGAVTTNYDTLLEEVDDEWSRNVVTTDSSRVHGLCECDEFYLLRLYGDLDIPKSAHLSQVEFAKEASGNTALRQTMQDLFRSRNLLFIGSSLEGIEHDLDRLGIRHRPVKKHYALVAVEGPGWLRKAKQLKRLYGLEVLPFSVHRAGTELTEFLQRLSEAAGTPSRKDTRSAGVPAIGR